MPRPDLLHALQGLMRCLVTTNDRAQGAGHLAQSDRRGILSRYNDAVEDVTFRKHAGQLAFLVEYTDCADFTLRHKLGCFEHARRFLQRVRLAVADDISNEHHRALLSEIGIVRVGLLYRQVAHAVSTELLRKNSE